MVRGGFRGKRILLADTGTVSELKFLVPWGHIAAKAWGSPQGRPVLCLHGWLDNANSFNRLIPLLPRDCYYIAIDLGGHGLSSHRPPGFPYHFLDYVKDVRRTVAVLKWSRFILIGHSFGGIVGGMNWEKMLKLKRDVIENLLNAEANHPQSPKVRSPQEALQRLLEANRHLTEESGKIILQRGATEVLGGLVYNRDVRVRMQIPADENMNVLKKIQADVLMIIAQNGLFAKGHSPTLLEQRLELYRTFLKEHFHFVKVAGNHFVHLNEPDVVAGIISTFLNKGQTLKANL